MSCHGRTRSQGCGAGLRGGRLGGTSPVGAEMELGDEDAVGRMATVGSGPVSCLLSQPPRPRASLGRTERWGLLSAKPPGPKQEDTRRGEQQAGPCPPLPDSPASGTARAISQQRKLRLRDRVFSGDTRGVGPGGASMWLAAPRPPSPGGGSVVPAGRFLPTAAPASPQPRGRQRRPRRPLATYSSCPVPPVHGAAASSLQAASCSRQLPRPPSPWWQRRPRRLLSAHGSSSVPQPGGEAACPCRPLSAHGIRAHLLWKRPRGSRAALPS